MRYSTDIILLYMTDGSNKKKNPDGRFWLKGTMVARTRELNVWHVAKMLVAFDLRLYIVDEEKGFDVCWFDFIGREVWIEKRVI